MKTSNALLLTSISLALALSACSGDDDGNGDDMGTRDGGPGSTRDGGPRDGGDIVVGCNNPALTPPANGTCAHTPGTNGALLIRGDVIGAEGFLENGHVLVGANGTVKCAACDCSGDAEFANAAVLECADGVISPALVNAHDHITFTETPPTPPTNPEERYDHRHQWRRGQDNKEEIPSVGNRGGNDGVLWGELRHLFGGATSINGSGGANGLIRNLDRNGAQQEGLNQQSVEYQTFPLADSSGTRRDTGCDYSSLDTPADYAENIAYAPHIAEGIDVTARNEFLCLSGIDSTGSDVLDSKTAVIHGIGLIATDYAAMAAEGSSLIWSPRSNISLYGHTAQVVLAKRSGVNIALGTDWTQTGSINLLRELRCAEQFNRENLGSAFNERELVAMVTSNAAASMGSAMRLGTLAAGREADITIFNGATNGGYRAILDADPEDIVLVLRSGSVLYGDAEIVSALPGGATGCEMLDVCGVNKRACVERETGSTINQIRSSLPDYTYDIFFCNEPPQEPTCIPFRTGEFMGMGMEGDADGDGVVDAMDNCPNVFNAPRPLDGMMQPDADDDMVGDACDVCPLNADTTNCTPPDPNDLDGDGTPNATDNCPGQPNADQADRDNDMIGDVCDACPDEPNLGGAACSASVYDIKQSNIESGRVRLVNMFVTGVSDTGAYLQRLEGDDGYDATLQENYSGIFVFAGSTMPPAVGDRVTVDGDINDFFGQKQLDSPTFTILSSDNPMPDPIAITPAEGGTGGTRAEALEAVFVRVGTVTVTEVEPAPGPGDSAPTFEFVVDGALRVNDHFYRVEPLPQVGDQITFIQGILRLGNGNSKIEPRNENDIGLPPGLRGFVPALTYARVGETGVPGSGFAVELSRPAIAQIQVGLSASGGITVPKAVTFDVGESSADVEVTATSSVGSPFTVTASYDDGMTTQTATGTVIVYDDAAPRSIEDATLDATDIPVNGTAMGMVTIDLPGAVGGTALTVTVTPAALATVPAVVVPQDQRTVTFVLTAGAMTGMGSVTIDTGSDSETIPFEVLQSTSRPPMAGDLIITEVHRNPSGSDEFMREWFEVYNASTDSILIDGMQVADNNGMETIAAPGVEIMPGEHVVIARLSNPANNGGVTAIADYDGAGNLQLANGGDNITLRYMGTELDTVAWSSGWPGAGQGVAMCLKFPYMDNAVQANWANSVGGFGTGGDTGHPGVASDATNCP
ncbi:MAG: lamin tail domain-containing protein [Deltaproteobacteria bacterium]|jgi:hypothetical protein